MTAAPTQFYLNDLECPIYVLVLRRPGAAEAHHGRQRAIWSEYSDTEALDGNQSAVIVRPSWASEPAA
jgi:hypothetical protein